MAPVPGDSPKTPAWHIDAVRGPSTPSFDHLVSAGEYGCRNIDAQRLRGLEVDDNVEFCRQYHRQFDRLLTLHNPADVVTGLAVGIGSAGTIADEAAGFGLLAISENRRHAIARHQDDQLNALTEEKGVGTYDECTDLLLLDGREGILYVALGAGIENQ